MTTSDQGTSDPSGRELARELLGPAWPRVRRIPLIRREIRESLSDNALEILFSTAELLVEGDAEDEGALERGDALESGRGYATVMLTLDLRDSASLLREPADEATALRVAELMRGSRNVRTLLAELARPELAAMFAAEPRALRIELLPVVRVSGTRILIDGDVVVSLRSGSSGSSGSSRSSRSTGHGQVGQ